MGRSLARALASRGDELALLGRDLEDLERSVADLQIRANRREGIVSVACDLAHHENFESVLADAKQQLGDLDTIIVTAGAFATQDVLEEDTVAAQALLATNFTQTVTFCEYARKLLLARGGGTLCVFSSVAGDRGRKPVVIYGASKAGLSAYLEGLDHKYRSQGLVTVCVKPGFVKTGMVAGLKPPPFAGEPEQVAKDVLAAIAKKEAVVYTPWIWRYIMLVIRMLPRAIMRKINF